MYELGSKSKKRVDVDLMIHLGMHPDEEGFFVEKRARVGYLLFFPLFLPPSFLYTFGCSSLNETGP